MHQRYAPEGHRRAAAPRSRAGRGNRKRRRGCLGGSARPGGSCPSGRRADAFRAAAQGRPLPSRAGVPRGPSGGSRTRGDARSRRSGARPRHGPARRLAGAPSSRLAEGARKDACFRGASRDPGVAQEGNREGHRPARGDLPRGPPAGAGRYRGRTVPSRIGADPAHRDRVRGRGAQLPVLQEARSVRSAMGSLHGRTENRASRPDRPADPGGSGLFQGAARAGSLDRPLLRGSGSAPRAAGGS